VFLSHKLVSAVRVQKKLPVCFVAVSSLFLKCELTAIIGCIIISDVH
jgi:hypothetical protein